MAVCTILASPPMMDRAVTDRGFFETQLGFLAGSPEEAVRTLLDVATADAALSLDERVVIQHLAAKVGVAVERFETLLVAAQERLSS